MPQIKKRIKGAVKGNRGKDRRKLRKEWGCETQTYKDIERQGLFLRKKQKQQQQGKSYIIEATEY